MTAPICAQAPQWVNYVNDCFINDVAVEGDDIWVGSQGGLTKIKRSTGERQSFLPFNSGFKGTGVNTIRIAPGGKKWIGGERGGLMSFDGSNWEHFYYINTGDTLVSVSKIVVAPNGDVWIKSIVNGNCWGCPKVFRYDGSSFERMDTIFGIGNPNNGSGPVHDFDIAPNGDVWVYSSSLEQQTFVNKVQRYDGSGVAGTFTEADLGLQPEENIRQILVSQTGEVYVQTSWYVASGQYKMALRKYDGNTWAVFPILGGNEFDGYCRYFFQSSNGDLWIQSHDENYVNTFCRFDGSNWESWLESEIAGLPPGQNSPDLLEVDSTGHWWMTYYTSGGIHADRLFEYDGVELKSYESEIFPLPSNYVDDMAFDCEGNAWFVGHDLLTRFDGVAWTDYTIADMGIPADYFSIWSITLDTATCDLWIAFYENNDDPIGFSKFDGSTFTHYSTPSGYDVFKVLVAPDGIVWVCSASDGLGRFDGSDWTWFNEGNSPLNSYLFDLTLDHQGRLWVSSYGDGVFVYDGTSWVNFNESNSPLSNYVYPLVTDRDGNVWMPSDTGPVRFAGTNWVSLPEPPPANATILAQELNGDFWLSDGRNIYEYDGSGYTQYNLLNAPLCGGGATDIRVDPFGNKWFLNGVGVTLFNEDGISNQVINPPFHVEGRTYFDANQDGSPAPSGEPGLPGQQITLLPQNLVTYSTFGGDYKLHPMPGSHQLSFQPSAPFVPTAATTLDLLMGSDNQGGFDFGAWTADLPDSIGTDLTTSFARCNQEALVWAHVTNFGLLDADLTVQLDFDPLLSFLFAEPAPASVSGNTIIWDLQGLSPFEYAPMVAHFQNPGFDAAGEWLDFALNATVMENGQPGQTVMDTASTELRCAYDPNDKQSEPVGASFAQYSLLGDALDFTIRFQNKGNDTAFVVAIRDTLDADLDPASFQLLAFSHPVRVTMAQGGVLTFVFEDINLLWEAADGPASQGFVKYRIAPKPGLPDPTDVRNTAHIYFDLNPAVVTNTTENTLVETLPSLAASDTPSEASLRIYPNPSADGSFWVEMGGQGPWEVQVSDVYGGIVRAFMASGKKASVEGLPTGVYFVSTWQEGRWRSGKVVVGR